MNDKLPIRRLAEIVAAQAEVSVDQAQNFTKSFFDIVSDELAKGDEMVIEGLGVFSVHDGDVKFVPDHDAAVTVNAPFDVFQATPLSSHVTDKMLSDIDEEHKAEPITPEPTVQSRKPEPADAPQKSEPVAQPRKSETAEASQKPEPEQAATPIPEQIHIPVPPIAPAKQPEPKVEPRKSEVATPMKPTISTAQPRQPLNPPKITKPQVAAQEEQPVVVEEKSGFTMGLIAGLVIGFAIGAAAAYFWINSLVDHQEETEVLQPIEEQIAAEDSLVSVVPGAAEAALPAAQPAPTAEQQQAQPQQPSQPQPKTSTAAVTDEVQPGYLLPRMAQKHYGNKVFWVYIYQDNQSKIRNPNTIAVGTKVTIPDAAKYGIDAKNEASVQKAREIERQLYNQFR